MMDSWLLWLAAFMVLSYAYHVTSQQGELKLRQVSNIYRFTSQQGRVWLHGYVSSVFMDTLINLIFSGLKTAQHHVVGKLVSNLYLCDKSALKNNKTIVHFVICLHWFCPSYASPGSSYGLATLNM